MRTPEQVRDHGQYRAIRNEDDLRAEGLTPNTTDAAIAKLRAIAGKA